MFVIVDKEGWVVGACSDEKDADVMACDYTHIYGDECSVMWQEEYDLWASSMLGEGQ